RASPGPSLRTMAPSGPDVRLTTSPSSIAPAVEKRSRLRDGRDLVIPPPSAVGVPGDGVAPRSPGAATGANPGRPPRRRWGAAAPLSETAGGGGATGRRPRSFGSGVPGSL